MVDWQATFLGLKQLHVAAPDLASLRDVPARQIEERLERIETLCELGVHRHFVGVPDDLLRRYARRLASRPPSAGRLIREPVRTIEVAYFMRYCLLICTDRVLLMVRRRVADL